MKKIYYKLDNDQIYEFVFHYEIGGNYPFYDRGYYASVKPCIINDQGGYYSVKTVSASGKNWLEMNVTRASKKAEQTAFENAEKRAKHFLTRIGKIVSFGSIADVL